MDSTEVVGNAELEQRPSACDDIATLETVDVPSIVELLRVRHLRGQPYAMCREVCISVNPLAWLPIYGAEERAKYSEGHADAHIYLTAQRAWAGVHWRSQTILVTGESGAGKTEVARLCLEYIAFRNAAGAGETIQAVLNTGPVLEYLGNAQTVRNGNSSRFGKFLRLHYDRCHQVGASIQTYLLEKSRVARTGVHNEGAFRIFYAVHEDAQLRDEHALHAIDMGVLGARHAAVQSSWPKFELAAQRVGLDADQIASIVSVVISISFLNIRDYANAALVLGIDHRSLTRTLSSRRIYVADEEIWTECENEETRSRTRALAMALYQHMFENVVGWMNRAVGPVSGQVTELNILDIFGFEMFERNGFEQLCINYCNERLQQLFVNDVIMRQQMEFANEGIVCDHIEFDRNDRIVELCDRVIFSAMNDALQAKATAESIVERIDSQRPSGFAIPLVRQSRCNTVFTVEHFAGTVMYDAEHFSERNADELRPELVELVQTSGRASIAAFFERCRVSSGKLCTTSVVSLFKDQMHSLTRTVGESDTHYIRCIKPNATATPGRFDAATVAQQVESTGLSHACRVMRTGFPVRVHCRQFLRMFKNCVQTRGRCASIGLTSDAGGSVDAAHIPAGLHIGAGDGFWGRTLVYMSCAYRERLVKREAAFVILGAIRRRVTRRRAAVRLQAHARRMASTAHSELDRRRERGARFIQHAMRRRRNRSSREYRSKSEVSKLRTQVESLKEVLRQRDASLFQAALLVKQLSSRRASEQGLRS